MLRNPFRSPSLVGVDIGSHSVKVVESRFDGPGRFRPLAQGEAPTAPGAYVGGLVQDPAALIDSLRRAVREAGVKGRRAVLAVPPQVGFVRKLLFPQMALGELRSVIELQPERYIPFARGGAVFDVHLTGSSAPEGQMWAVVAAAPRRCIEELTAVVSGAGLKPVRVDLEPLALHRAAVANGQTAPEAGAAVVDLGASVAKVSLFEGDVPVISRVLDLPSAAGEASAGLGGAGLDDLFLDIRRSLEYALTKTEAPPRSVLLTGGSGMDVHVALSLTGYLRGYLSSRLPQDFRVDFLRDTSGAVAGARMLALGLSLPPELVA